MRAALRIAALCIVIFNIAGRPSDAQTLPSEARGSAISQIVMLSVNDQGCAAGIIVGYDEKNVYVATAAHILADPSASQTSTVTSKFSGIAAPRKGRFFPKLAAQSDGDLAVVVVDRDPTLNAYLDGLNFAMLPSSKTIVANRPVTSIGCWGGSTWAQGDNETLLSADTTLRVSSTVNEGQSGGGLFSDAWELIGMPLATGVNEISARPISAVLDDLRSWNVPVQLRTRAPKDRVMGAEELAQRVLRRDLSQRLASQSADTRADAPVRALLLGVEAVNQSRANGYPTAAAREALAESLLRVSGVGLAGHSDTIEYSAFSADDRYLATASEDGLIRIWNLAAPGIPTTVKVLQDQSRAKPDFMTFDKGSQRFISFTYGREQRDGSATVWALDTPKPAPLSVQAPVATNKVTAAASSADNEVLAFAAEDRVLIYSLAGGGPLRPLRTLSIPGGSKVTHFAFSRNAKVLLAGANAGRVLIWDLASRSDGPVSIVDTQSKPVGPMNDIPDLDLIVISDDHRLLMTGSTKWTFESSFADPAIKLWPLKDLKPTGEVTVLDQAQDEASKALVEAFLTEGARILVATTLTGKVSVWDLAATDGARTPAMSFKLMGHVGGAARSSDGRVFAVGYGNAIELMRTTDRQGTSLPRVTLRGFDSSLRRVEISRSGRFLFGAGIGGSGRLWDLHRVDPISPAGTVVPTPYVEVTPVKVSATGRTAAVKRKDKLEIWNVSEPTRPNLLYTTSFQAKMDEEGACPSCNVILSADDRWLVVQPNEGDPTLEVVEIGSQSKSRHRFIIRSDGSRPWDDVTFSPDNQWLFFEEAGNVLVAYDLGLSEPKRVVLSEGRPFYSLEFSPDNKWLFLRGMQMYQQRHEEDGFLVPLASLTNRTTWTPLKGFVRGIGSLEFSAAGDWVAISGEGEIQERELDDRRVQLLRLEGGKWKNHTEFSPIEYAASALQFSPDGQWLFTGSGDITLGDRNVSARVWNLNAPIVEAAGQTLPSAVWNIKQVAFSPDSKWLITASGAQTYAALWRLKNGRVELVSRLSGPVPKLNNRWYFKFSPDSKMVVIWTLDDATPFFWNLDDQVVSETGVAIPNGDREIQQLDVSKDGRSLIILNSGGTNTGTSGSEGAHFTLVDLEHFPMEDAYAVLPAGAAASSFIYREDLGFIVSLGTGGIVISPTDLDLQLARANVAAGRNLSWEEWKKTPLRGTYRPTFPDRAVTPDVIEAVLPSIGTLRADGRQAEATQLQQNVIRWARGLHDGKVCNSVAWNLAELGAADAALEFAQCALQAAPSDPDFRDTHGYVLARLGRREEAIREFIYFIENTQGIDRFKRSADVRRRWVERLRAGQDPFAASPN